MIEKLKNWALTAVTIGIGMIASTFALFVVVWWLWFLWEMVKFVFRYSMFDNPF